MNETTTNTLRIANALADRGLTVAGVEAFTPDGRTWSIVAEIDGGFRLFEIDRDQGTTEEHDAVDAETWTTGDLLDYLVSVGQPKAR